MSLTEEDVKKIAHLARLTMSENDLTKFTTQLSGILDFVEQMNKVDTKEIPALAHPLDLSQRLRPDVITEENKRDINQSIAPRVEAGLYIVPQVIDAE